MKRTRGEGVGHMKTNPQKKKSKVSPRETLIKKSSRGKNCINLNQEDKVISSEAHAVGAPEPATRILR